MYTEGNRRKTHPKAENNPGGGDKERYSTGRRDRSTGAITETKRGGKSAAYSTPSTPSPKSGDRPGASRVHPRFSGLKTPAQRYATVGNWKGGGQANPTMGDTLTKDLHMAARSNTGARPAYTAPGFSGRKAK